MPLRTETLLSNQLGNVAVIFAFCLVPIAALIAFSIDFNIASSNKSRVQVVIDAAAVSGAKTFSVDATRHYGSGPVFSTPSSR